MAALSLERLGAVNKGRPHKITKILPSLSVQTHHNFEKSVFFAPKSADVYI